MAARRSKRYFSTSRAVAAKRARRRNERGRDQRGDEGAASHRGDGAALRLPVTLVLDPAAGADLLAGGAALRMEISAVIHRPEFELFSPLQQRYHRPAAHVGRLGPRP